MMNYQEIKRKYALTDTEIAQMFGYKNRQSFASSSAKKRIEEGIQNFHNFIMKRLSILLLLALTISFAACSSDDDLSDLNDSDNPSEDIQPTDPGDQTNTILGVWYNKLSIIDQDTTELKNNYCGDWHTDFKDNGTFGEYWYSGCEEHISTGHYQIEDDLLIIKHGVLINYCDYTVDEKKLTYSYQDTLSDGKILHHKEVLRRE